MKDLFSRITKRGIAIPLGLLWLLDGALQLQHQMFTSNFANNVIAPAAQGQPGIVSGPMNLMIHVVLTHPAIFDGLFALIQIGLGALILWRRTARIGLLASVAWGLGVWYLGEGLGGLLSGQTSLLLGAPGAALLYVILAIAILPNPSNTSSEKVDRPGFWLPIAWAILWVGGAIYQLLPGQNTTSYLASTLSDNASGAPGWLAALDTHASNLLHGGVWIVGLLALIQALIGLLIFFPGRLRRSVVGIGILLSLTFWFLGQSLGDYSSGLATDPNTAPLFIILGVAVLGSAQLGFKQLWQRVTQHSQRSRGSGTLIGSRS